MYLYTTDYLKNCSYIYLLKLNIIKVNYLPYLNKACGEGRQLKIKN